MLPAFKIPIDKTYQLGYDIADSSIDSTLYILNDTKIIAKRTLKDGIEDISENNREVGRLKKKYYSLYPDRNKRQEQDLQIMFTDAFDELKEEVEFYLEEQGESQLQEQADLEELEALKREEQIEYGNQLLEEIEHPLHYIYGECRWYSAGEPNNILYTFLTYCAQVILKQPISVIGIGDGGSGKTHVLGSGLHLIPEEYILTQKSCTESVLYRTAADDPYYYDGKIVNIGDMGGMSDHQDAQHFKNAIKELQSDGHIRKPINIQVDGEWIPTWFELYGNPCLTYTNVPGHEYDDQEISRSIFITPRKDNDHMVSLYDYIHEDLETPAGQEVQKHLDNIPKIQAMVLALAHKMETVKVINPYRNEIDKFLQGSRFYKRDNKKFKTILKIISIFNNSKNIYNNRIYVTRGDIELFLEILSEYRRSIVNNLTPGASQILDDIESLSNQMDVLRAGTETSSAG